jgi:hypothetical protein
MAISVNITGLRIDRGQIDIQAGINPSDELSTRLNENMRFYQIISAP